MAATASLCFGAGKSSWTIWAFDHAGVGWRCKCMVAGLHPPTDELNLALADARRGAPLEAGPR